MLEVGLTFLTGVLSVDVGFQVIEACKLLVAMLAGKRFLSLMVVQVSFVRCQVVEFLLASVAFVRKVAYKHEFEIITNYEKIVS